MPRNVHTAKYYKPLFYIIIEKQTYLSTQLSFVLVHVHNLPGNLVPGSWHPGAILLTDISPTSKAFSVWISNYIYIKDWRIITVTS